MNAVTVTTDQLMTAVLGLIGLYVVGYNIKWIWKVKRIIFHIALTLTAATSGGGLLTNFCQRKGEANARARAEVNEARTAQIRLIRETREAPATPLPECLDPKQVNLPGAWWGLYQTLKDSSYWEAKLLAIESFPIHYGVTEVEPLPTAGFNLILAQVDVEGNNGRSWKHIKRAKAALNQYLAPFNEAPICFAKAETNTEPKEEKKDG